MNAFVIDASFSRSSPFSPPLDEQTLVLLRRGDYHAAETRLIQALAIRPSRIELLYYLGYCTLHQGRYHDAIQFFKRVISREPRFADSYGAIGNCHRSLGHFHDAERYFRKAIRRAPNQSLYHSNLGDVFFSAWPN